MKYFGSGFVKRSTTSKRQAAEKYLKCLLTYLGIQAPRTHDLIALAALLPLEQTFPVPVEDLAELNPYSVDVRYADDWREPQLSDANRAIELASQVQAAVRKALPPFVLA